MIQNQWIDLIHARDFSKKRRKKLAKSGAALPDGSFPIQNKEDLKNAEHMVGLSKNPAKAKAHVKQRAKALGMKAGGPGSGRHPNQEAYFKHSFNISRRLGHSTESSIKHANEQVLSVYGPDSKNSVPLVWKEKSENGMKAGGPGSGRHPYATGDREAKRDKRTGPKSMEIVNHLRKNGFKEGSLVPYSAFRSFVKKDDGGNRHEVMVQHEGGSYSIGGEHDGQWNHNALGNHNTGTGLTSLKGSLTHLGLEGAGDLGDDPALDPA